MGYDWRQFLVFAEQLHQEGMPAVAAATIGRVAISRAYYAAFHEARRFVETRYFIKFGPKGIHYELKQWFLGDHDTTYQAIGELLGRLVILRTRADYEGRDDPTTRDVINALAYANRIIELVHRL